MANLSNTHKIYRFLEGILTRYLLTDRTHRSAHRQRFSTLAYIAFIALTLFSALTFGTTPALLVCFLGCCTCCVIEQVERETRLLYESRYPLSFALLKNHVQGCPRLSAQSLGSFLSSNLTDPEFQSLLEQITKNPFICAIIKKYPLYLICRHQSTPLSRQEVDRLLLLIVNVNPPADLPGSSVEESALSPQHHLNDMFHQHLKEVIDGGKTTFKKYVITNDGATYVSAQELFSSLKKNAASLESLDIDPFACHNAWGEDNLPSNTVTYIAKRLYESSLQTSLPPPLTVQSSSEKRQHSQLSEILFNFMVIMKPDKDVLMLRNSHGHHCLDYIIYDAMQATSFQVSLALTQIGELGIDRMTIAAATDPQKLLNTAQNFWRLNSIDILAPLICVGLQTNPTKNKENTSLAKLFLESLQSIHTEPSLRQEKHYKYVCNSLSRTLNSENKEVIHKWFEQSPFNKSATKTGSNKLRFLHNQLLEMIIRPNPQLRRVPLRTYLTPHPQTPQHFKHSSAIQLIPLEKCMDITTASQYFTPPYKAIPHKMLDDLVHCEVKQPVQLYLSYPGNIFEFMNINLSSVEIHSMQRFVKEFAVAENIHETLLIEFFKSSYANNTNILRGLVNMHDRDCVDLLASRSHGLDKFLVSLEDERLSQAIENLNQHFGGAFENLGISLLNALLNHIKENPGLSSDYEKLERKLDILLNFNYSTALQEQVAMMLKDDSPHFYNPLSDIISEKYSLNLQLALRKIIESKKCDQWFEAAILSLEDEHLSQAIENLNQHFEVVLENLGISLLNALLNHIKENPGLSSGYEKLERKLDILLNFKYPTALQEQVVIMLKDDSSHFYKPLSDIISEKYSLNLQLSLRKIIESKKCDQWFKAAILSLEDERLLQAIENLNQHFEGAFENLGISLLNAMLNHIKENPGPSSDYEKLERKLDILLNFNYPTALQEQVAIMLKQEQVAIMLKDDSSHFYNPLSDIISEKYSLNLQLALRKIIESRKCDQWFEVAIKSCHSLSLESHTQEECAKKSEVERIKFFWQYFQRKHVNHKQMIDDLTLTGSIINRALQNDSFHIIRFIVSPQPYHKAQSSYIHYLEKLYEILKSKYNQHSPPDSEEREFVKYLAFYKDAIINNNSRSRAGFSPSKNHQNLKSRSRIHDKIWPEHSDFTDFMKSHVTIFTQLNTSLRWGSWDTPLPSEDTLLPKGSANGRRMTLGFRVGLR